jgi:hypothetical protein
VRHARRSLRWWWDDDGSLVIIARLAPESGAAVLAVLEPIADELAAAERATDAALASAAPATLDDVAPPPDPTPADAPPGSAHVGHVQAPAGDHDHGDEPEPDHGTAPGDAAPTAAWPEPVPWWAVPGADPLAQRWADALVEAMHRLAHGEGGVRAEIQALVDLDLLTHDGSGRCHLLHGPALDPDALELLRCDATLTALVEAEGQVVASGPRTPTIPAATRRAVLARDLGCVFPACPSRRVQLHHVRVRTRDGAHTTANLVALCAYHHQRLHREGWVVQRDDHGQVAIHLPDGRVLHAAPRTDPGAAGGPGPLAPAPGGPDAVTSEWAGEHLDLRGTVAELVRRARAAATAAAGAPAALTPHDDAGRAA